MRHTNPIAFVCTLLLAISCCVGFDVLASSKDSAYIGSLFNDATRKKGQNVDSAEIILIKAYNESVKLHYYDGAAESLLRIGEIYTEQGNFQAGIIYSFKAIDWSSKAKQKQWLPICYNNIGRGFNYMGNFAKAALYLDSAIHAIQTSNESSRALQDLLGKIYSNLAGLYLGLNQPQKALEYLKKGEPTARKNNSKEVLGFILINQGCAYYSLNEVARSFTCFQEALAIGKAIKNDQLLVGANINIGQNLVDQKKPAIGIPFLKEAISISKRVKLLSYMIGASYCLGDAYIRTRKYKLAIETINDALLSAKKLSLYDKPTLDAHQSLANAYEACGQYSDALKEHKKFTHLKDSLMGIDQAKAINELEVKYRTAQKDKEAAQKDKEITKSKLEIANQKLTIGRKNTLLWISLLVVLMIFVTSVLIYRNIKHRQDLDTEKLRVMEQEQDIQLLKAMMSGEERERIRIGRELHDGIGGLLSAAKMNFDTLRNHNTELAEAKDFKNTIQLIDEATGELRKTAHNLMPEILLKGGLGEAVRSFCERLPASSINFQVHVYGNLPRLDASFELSIYRIIQEQIQNIIKHAKATEALVQLNWPDEPKIESFNSEFAIGSHEMGERLFQIAVEDNGIGLSIDDMQKDSGIGLKNMQARIRALEGHMEIESKPGIRTAVYIEFAVEKIKLAAS